MNNNRQTNIRLIRAYLTYLLIIIYTWYYDVPERAWAFITVWVVTYEFNTIGGVLTKSMVRLYGTLVTATYAVIIIYFFGNNAIINILAVFPGVYVLNYYFFKKEDSYVGIIGIVTLSFVLVNYYDIDLAILRLFNVILGIIAAIIMIFVFYPQYARDELITQQINLITLFSDIIDNYLDFSKSEEIRKEIYTDFEHKMIESFAAFGRIAQAAKIETFKTPLFITHNMNALAHIKTIFRLFSSYTTCSKNEKQNDDRSMSHHINNIKLDLESIKKQLESSQQETMISLEESTDKIVLNDETGNFIDTIFLNISKEIRLLRDEITQMLSIYAHYQ